MKAEDKGISPQRHEDQHKGPQRRPKAADRVQKTEGKEQKGNKGRQRTEGKGGSLREAGGVQKGNKGRQQSLERMTGSDRLGCAAAV
jgi:hypothetical protein